MDNINIMILSKEFEKPNMCCEIEPWFQTRYEAKGKILISAVNEMTNFKSI